MAALSPVASALSAERSMSGPLRLLVAMSACGASKPAEPQRASTLAPTLAYLELWTFIYGKDATLPKVLYLPRAPEEGEEAGGGSAEPPSWLTSAAMAFKDGRSYTAKFAVVAADDSARVAKRFGIEADELPVLLGCRVADGGSGGVAHRMPKSDLRAGGGTTVRAVKEFVKDLAAGDEAEENGSGALALPSFPEPTRPRKQATASLDEFTHESLPLSCYAGPRPLCVLAVLDQAAGNGCPEAMSEVGTMRQNARRHAAAPAAAPRVPAWESAHLPMSARVCVSVSSRANFETTRASDLAVSARRGSTTSFARTASPPPSCPRSSQSRAASGLGRRQCHVRAALRSKPRRCQRLSNL